MVLPLLAEFLRQIEALTAHNRKNDEVDFLCIPTINFKG